MTDPGRALVTGGSGFLGRYVVGALHQLGREVTVLCRQPQPGPIGIPWDLALGPAPLDRPIGEIYHLAGLAHRRARSRTERDLFEAVNFQGTRNLLEGLENLGQLPESLVFASTVAVYGVSSGSDLNEDTPRNALDPYGNSKLRAEDLILDWGQRRGVRVGFIRLPLVAGSNPPGNLGAMVRAIRKGYYLGVGDGLARRSVVLARDVAGVLPKVSENGGIYHLTDGNHPSFQELEESLSAALGRDLPRRVPLTVARTAGRIGDFANLLMNGRFPISADRVEKMTSELTFSDEKARGDLGWVPTRVVESAAEIVSVDTETSEPGA